MDSHKLATVKLMFDSIYNLRMIQVGNYISTHRNILKIIDRVCGQCTLRDVETGELFDMPVLTLAQSIAKRGYKIAGELKYCHKKRGA